MLQAIIRVVRAIYCNMLSGLVVLSAIMIGVIWLSVSSDVVMRYFLGQPMSWVTEVTGYLMLWMTFLATAWVLRQDKHVTIDVVLVRLNPGNRALLLTFTYIIGAILCLVIGWYGAQTVWTLHRGGVYLVTILQLPKAPILMIIPIGFFLLFVEFARMSYKHLRQWRVPLKSRKRGE